MHSLLTPLKTPAMVTFSLLLLLTGSPIHATEVTDNPALTSTTCKMLSPPLQGTKDAYHDIFECFRNNAEQGDIAAIVNLAHSYYFGIGIPQNFQKALRWYTEAADSDNAEAMFRIGVMYAEGHGVEKNAEKSQEWYDKAVATGDAQAEYNIGIVKTLNVMEKAGTRKPMEESDQIKTFDDGWLTRSAEKNYMQAQLRLGMLYYFGFGDRIKPHPELAEKWLKSAAQQGSYDAASLLAHLYLTGTPATPIDPTLAYIWSSVASQIQGTPLGFYNYAFRLQQPGNTSRIAVGKMSQDNIENAEKAISNIHKEIARHQLEIEDGRYANDFINITNRRPEINWENIKFKSKPGDVISPGYIAVLQNASNNNDIKAQSDLGMMYLQGIGVPQNYEKALDLLTKSAEQNNNEAAFSLGVMYASKQGVDLDVAKAKNMMVKAALYDHTLAAYALSTNLDHYICQTRHPKSQPPSIEIIKEAYIWASISVAYGLPGHTRSCLLLQMPADQIAQSQKDAATLFEKIHENIIIKP